jgi:hypothetical protein
MAAREGVRLGKRAPSVSHLIDVAMAMYRATPVLWRAEEAYHGQADERANGAGSRAGSLATPPAREETGRVARDLPRPSASGEVGAASGGAVNREANEGAQKCTSPIQSDTLSSGSSSGSHAVMSSRESSTSGSVPSEPQAEPVTFGSQMLRAGLAEPYPPRPAFRAPVTKESQTKRGRKQA